MTLSAHLQDGGSVYALPDVSSSHRMARAAGLASGVSIAGLLTSRWASSYPPITAAVLAPAIVAGNKTTLERSMDDGGPPGQLGCCGRGPGFAPLFVAGVRSK